MANFSPPRPSPSHYHSYRHQQCALVPLLSVSLSLPRASHPLSFNWHRESFFLSLFFLSLSFSALSLSLLTHFIPKPPANVTKRHCKSPPLLMFWLSLRSRAQQWPLAREAVTSSPFLYSCNWTAAVHVCEYFFFFPFLCILQEASFAASFSVFLAFITLIIYVDIYTYCSAKKKEHSLTWMASCSIYGESLTCIWTWVSKLYFSKLIYFSYPCSVVKLSFWEFLLKQHKKVCIMFFFSFFLKMVSCF